MASEKAIYEPGELDKVKQRLGAVDEKEAQRMQKILGGEVGRERTESEAGAAFEKTGGLTKPKHVVDILPLDEEAPKKKARTEYTIIPNAPIPYGERVKMDVCCGDPEFGIKTTLQVLVSRLSFFKAPNDLVSPHFVRHRLHDYYKNLEILVSTVRLQLPKANKDRAAQLKKESPFAYAVLDVFRFWKINQISTEIGKLQSHPRSVTAAEFQPILREVYRPLYLLDDLEVETDIQDVFRSLHKVMLFDCSAEEADRERKRMANAIVAYDYLKNKAHYFLYPLLMKNISSAYYEYHAFFSACAERIRAFLEVTDDQKIRPAAHGDALLDDMLSGNEMNAHSFPESKSQAAAAFTASPAAAASTAASTSTAAAEAPEAAKSAYAAEEAEPSGSVEDKKIAAAESKAVDKGVKTLEMLFPQSRLSRCEDFPDYYPYFAAIFTFKKGSELISPKDPVQFALILSAIIEEMLLGFRSIKFLGEAFAAINPVMDEWNYVLDESFYNTYLRLVEEYVSSIKTAGAGAKSSYVMNLANDIQWAKRYYFFPSYDYKSGLPPSFSRRDIRSMFSLARKLRKGLTSIAVDIESANRQGGMVAGAFCPTIQNPWDAYVFDIANPISKRLDALLPKEQKTNVSLLFFALAAATVLDNHFSNLQSAAYHADNDAIFRSVDNAGREAILWVDRRTDVDEIFKASIKPR